MILVGLGTVRTLHPPPPGFNSKIVLIKFSISFAEIRYSARANEQAFID
jgi:hypothetical protein